MWIIHSLNHAGQISCSSNSKAFLFLTILTSLEILHGEPDHSVVTKYSTCVIFIPTVMWSTMLVISFSQKEITFIHPSTLPCFCFHPKTFSCSNFWFSYLQVAMRSFVSILCTLTNDIYCCIPEIIETNSWCWREKRCWKCWWTHDPLKLRPLCSVLFHFQRNARRRRSERQLLQTLASVSVLLI